MFRKAQGVTKRRRRQSTMAIRTKALIGNGLLVVAVAFAGICVLWHATDGFRAFTAESARRLSVLEHPQKVPEVRLQDQSGRELTLEAYRGQWLLATFIYTRCADLCPALETSFQEVYEGLPRERLGKDVSLLTISFDRANDTVEALHHYMAYFQADGETWRMTRVSDGAELDRLLKRFGVVVIPDRNGGFEHNAAIYLVSPEGKLVRIFDYDDPGQVVRYMRETRA